MHPLGSKTIAKVFIYNRNSNQDFHPPKVKRVANFKSKDLTSIHNQIVSQHTNMQKKFKQNFDKRKLKTMKISSYCKAEKLNLGYRNNHPQKANWILSRQQYHQMFDKFDQGYQVVYVECENIDCEGNKKVQQKPECKIFEQKSPISTRQVNWKNISTIWKQPVVFYDQILPTDIIEGCLANRYFLCGVAALIEKPTRIIQLIEKVSSSSYQVKIMKQGKWYRMHLNGLIPCIEDSPAFGRTKARQTWLILLEKAWAKLYGGYAQIESGFIQEPLHDLTGAPIEHIFLKKIDPDLLWEYLKQATAKEYAMVAHSKSVGQQEETADGILLQYAYTFLGVKEIYYKNKMERLVQLRDPWRVSKFRGRWSSTDPIWMCIQQEQKQSLGLNKQYQKQGIFLMNYEQFRYDFHNITVAQIIDNSCYICQSVCKRQSNDGYFIIEIKTEGTYSLQVDKPSKRSVKKDKYQYPEVEFEIGRLQMNGVVVLESLKSSEKRRMFCKKFNLYKGKYIVWVKFNFSIRIDQSIDITLGVYSQTACLIREAATHQIKQYSDMKSIQKVCDSGFSTSQSPNPKIVETLNDTPKYKSKLLMPIIEENSRVPQSMPEYSHKQQSTNNKSNQYSQQITSKQTIRYGYLSIEELTQQIPQNSVIQNRDTIENCQSQIQINYDNVDLSDRVSSNNSSLVYQLEDQIEGLDIQEEQSILIFKNLIKNNEPSIIEEAPSSQQDSSYHEQFKSQYSQSLAQQSNELWEDISKLQNGSYIEGTKKK